jgi:hypothetical protein
MCAPAASSMVPGLKHFIVKVEGLALEELEEVELPVPPAEGEPIETRYGTCVILRTELFEGDARYDGQIVCRLP